MWKLLLNLAIHGTRERDDDDPLQYIVSDINDSTTQYSMIALLYSHIING